MTAMVGPGNPEFATKNRRPATVGNPAIELNSGGYEQYADLWNQFGVRVYVKLAVDQGTGLESSFTTNPARSGDHNEFSTILDQGRPQLFLEYKARMKELHACAAEEGLQLNPESERDFWKFVESLPSVRTGSLVLMNTGNLRGIWRDGPENHLGLQFLGGQIVQYVIFKRREPTQPISRVSGRDTFDDLKRRIHAFDMSSLLSR